MICVLDIVCFPWLMASVTLWISECLRQSELWFNFRFQVSGQLDYLGYMSWVSCLPIHFWAFRGHPYHSEAIIQNLESIDLTTMWVTIWGLNPDAYRIRSIRIGFVRWTDICFYLELEASVETSPLFCSVERSRKALAHTFHRTDWPSMHYCHTWHSEGRIIPHPMHLCFSVPDWGLPDGSPTWPVRWYRKS